jgi:hypothetical protein
LDAWIKRGQGGDSFDQLPHVGLRDFDQARGFIRGAGADPGARVKILRRDFSVVSRTGAVVHFCTIRAALCSLAGQRPIATRPPVLPRRFQLTTDAGGGLAILPAFDYPGRVPIAALDDGEARHESAIDAVLGAEYGFGC